MRTIRMSSQPILARSIQILDVSFAAQADKKTKENENEAENKAKEIQECREAERRFLEAIEEEELSADAYYELAKYLENQFEN